MTSGCEMNQILLRTLKMHLKRYILGEKCITIVVTIIVTIMVTTMVTTIVTTMVAMINLGYHRSN